jgi:3-phosphoshikimate 1-carboxyvinyltransferase
MMELTKIGARVEERRDGIDILGIDGFTGPAVLDAHLDHRVATALSVAGLCAEQETVITRAENFVMSYPGFINDMNALGSALEIEDGQ